MSDRQAISISGAVATGVLVGILLGALADSDDTVGRRTDIGPVATADSWTIFRGDAALSGLAAGEIGSDLEIAWKFSTQDAITSSPIIVGDLAYVGSNDGTVYAIELQTGKERWSFATEDMVEAPPLYHDGRIYIGSNDARLYALDAATGKKIWSFETGDKIMGSANLARGADGGTILVVGSYDTKLYGISTDGSKIWEYQTDNYVNGTPAITDNMVIFGGCDAALHMVSASSGRMVDKLVLDSDCHIAGSVALDGRHAYFGHYGNAFICVDIERGELAWDYPSPRHGFFSSPAIGTDRIVFGGRDKALHCVRRDNGELIWKFPTKRKVDCSAVICGDKVCFGSGDGRFYVLSLEDGSEHFRYEIGQSIFSSPAVAQGYILVGSMDGTLYAFRGKGG